LEIAIQNFHFCQCSNNNCKAIFPIGLEEAKKANQQFCPKCSIALTNSHLVQCENCQAIINFIPLFPKEEAVVFYVPKCTMCSGTIKDEKRLARQYFPKSFI
jgi:hypothetical protein